MFRSRSVEGPSDWKKVEVEAPVPAGAKKWMVRCGVEGRGRVSFDDVALASSKEKGELLGATLAVGEGKYRVQAQSNAEDPWIRFSIPFPFEWQTPLAIRVESDPPDAVARFAVKPERENRPLEVVLKPRKRGETVRLRARFSTRGARGVTIPRHLVMEAEEL